MKKVNILWIILDLIFLIIFNAIFFAAGGIEHHVSVWISYAFIHFAYFMLLLTPKLIRPGKSSTIFGFSLYAISSVYFLVVFTAGITFILFLSDNFTVPFLVQICIAGLYSIILIAHMIANEHTADAEEKREHQIAFIKDASAKLKNLLEAINDKETRKKAERVYDALNSSQVKSHPDLEQTENIILSSINELEGAIKAEKKDTIISLIDSLLNTINERNMRLKNLN